MIRIPWHIPVVLAVTTFIHYMDRNNIAIILPELARTFRWNDQALGQYGEWILGAFYVSFGLTQIFLSHYTEKLGLRRSLLASVSGFSVVTLLFYPLGYSLSAIILLRLLLGVAESLHMPANSAIVSRYFPPSHRARANSIYVGGILVALMAGPWIIIPLAEKLGWRHTFLILGSAGLIVGVPLILRFIPRDPPKENAHGFFTLFSWREVFQGYGAPRPLFFWVYVAAGAANAFCVFGMLNWLPTYLHRRQGIAFDDLSLPLFGIFGAGIGGLLGWAFLGDRRGQRTLAAAVGLFLAGVCVWLTAYTDSSLGGTIALLVLGIFFQSSYNAQEFATLQEMVSGHRVGAASGLYNGLTVLIGGVGGRSFQGRSLLLRETFKLGFSAWLLVPGW